MTNAEKQARRREQFRQMQDALSQTRGALSRISDVSSERFRTKADLQEAVDRMGLLAAEALAQSSH